MHATGGDGAVETDKPGSDFQLKHQWRDLASIAFLSEQSELPDLSYAGLF